MSEIRTSKKVAGVTALRKKVAVRDSDTSGSTTPTSPVLKETWAKRRAS